MKPLHYNITGTGKSLVMLHGFGFHIGIWQSLIPYLSPHLQLIMIDLPGFGKSEPIDDYQLAALSESVLAICPPSASYLGWSLGGLLAMHIAIHHPERIEKLITIASTPKFVTDNDWPGTQADTLQTFIEQITLQPQRTLKRFNHLMFHGMNNARALQKQTHETMLQHQPHPFALQGGLTLLRDTDLREQLHLIHCPQLHLLGEQDTLIPVNMMQTLTKLTPQAKITTLHDASHAPFLSHPIEVSEHIKALLP